MLAFNIGYDLPLLILAVRFAVLVMSNDSNPTSQDAPPEASIRDEWRDGLQIGLAVFVGLIVCGMPFSLIVAVPLAFAHALDVDLPPWAYTAANVAFAIYFITIYPVLLIRYFRSCSIGFYSDVRTRLR